MSTPKALYETVVVFHPELTEEEAEGHVQTLIKFLEDRSSEILRIDRGGKRRLAYPIRKQRYGYYDLVHFRTPPETLAELERYYRLTERVLRYLTVRFEKEEHLTGFTRVPDDEGRDEDREERRRGGRRGDMHHRDDGRGSSRDMTVDDLDEDDDFPVSALADDTEP